MKKRTRVLAIILIACIVIATLAGCKGKTPDAPAATNTGANNQQPPAAKRDTLSVGVYLDAGTLDPLFMTGKGGYLSVQRTFCEPLWDFDAKTGERFWVLATAYDCIEGMHYKMKIREGVTFSNGNKLTAEDVLFTMRLNAADSRAWLNVKGINVDKSSVIDDYTIDIWLDRYEASMELGIVQMQIVDHRTYDINNYTSNPIGTGAYVVKEYVPNSHITVERRDDYWGPKPEIKTIYFKCLNELSQRVNALETGDVDISIITTQNIAHIESLGTIKVDVRDVGSSLVALYNMSDDGPLNSIAAREAVSWAIDRQAISNVAFNGKAGIPRFGASESFIELQDRYMNMHDLYKEGMNIDKAKQLAEQAGLVGKTLKIVTNGDPTLVTVAEVIQNGLEKIGVKSTITNYDQSTFFEFLMGMPPEYDIGINQPVSPASQPCDIFGMYPQFMPQGWSGPDREAYVELAVAANSEPNLQKRQDITYEMLKMHTKFLLWFGLCEDPLIYAYNKELKNVQYTLSGLTLFQNIKF